MADSKISALSSGAPAQAGDEYIVARSGANYKLTLTNIAANMPATTVASGDLIVSSGNVGIGIASPGYKFDVVKGSVGDVARFTNGVDASLIVGAPTGGITYNQLNGGYQSWQIANSEKMRLDSSGNVGIGTASPAAKLEVSASTAGDGIRIGGNNFAGTNYFGASVNPTGVFTGLDAGGGFAINVRDAGYQTFSTNNQERMRIDSSGNVGIGTSSPATAFGKSLHLYNDANTGTVASNTFLAIESVNRNANIDLSGASTATNAVSFSDTLGTTVAAVASSIADSNLLFRTGGTTERMRIDSEGRVGIGGTAGAYEKLSVRGTLPTSSAFSFSYVNEGTVPSGTTQLAVGFYSAGTTQATSFTLSNYQHFRAWQGGFGAGSTVLNQYGFVAESTLTGATNNYGFYSNIASGSNRWNFYANGTAANYFAGETYVGGTTDNGAYNLQCNGTGVWGAGAYVNGSDERLKDDITTLNDGLNVVSQLRPVTFKYKPDYSKDQNVQTGFIAQELQAALEGKDYADGVVQAGPEYLNVAYQSLIPILVKAVQELKAELDTLKGNA